ncbi:MAG: thioredoxin domain-containing protein [Verrucomicrobiota bacterium]
MKRFLPFLIIGAVALTAVGGAVTYYRAKRPAAVAVSAEAAKAVAGEPHTRGGAEAKVTLEEFGDFQCPPCGVLFETLEPLEKKYGQRLRVIFRQYPLASHTHAMEAALAAEAAGFQGRFWEMHDMLYRKRADWIGATEAGTIFHQYAATLGLNLEQFEKDAKGSAARTRIAADEKRAKDLSVALTPTVYWNNQAMPFEKLAPASLPKMIDEAMVDKAP